MCPVNRVLEESSRADQRAERGADRGPRPPAPRGRTQGRALGRGGCRSHQQGGESRAADGGAGTAEQLLREPAIQSVVLASLLAAEPVVEVYTR